MDDAVAKARARTGQAGAPGRASPRRFALGFGALGRPLGWATHLVLGDLVFELGCSPGVGDHALFGVGLEVWSWLQTGVLATVTTLAGILAWRALRLLRPLEPSTAVLRARAMAVAGVGSACLYLAIILYGVLPPLVLHRCSPSL